MGGGVERILGWVKVICPAPKIPTGKSACGGCNANDDPSFEGRMCEGDGGATESEDDAGEGKCDMDPLDEVSEGKGYSNGVLLVAKGVPTI